MAIGNSYFSWMRSPESVVDVEVRHLIRASRRVPVANPSEIDLPMLVAGSFRIIGTKGWSSLGQGPPNNDRQKEYENADPQSGTEISH